MKQIISILVIFSLATYAIANKVEQELDDIICKGFSEDAESRADCGFEERINNLIEVLRKLLQEGDPERGIPSFDPLKVDNLVVNPNSAILSGNLEITNLKLQGITDFIKTEGCLYRVGLINRQLSLGLKFDKIVLTTDYTGALDILEIIDIFGTGNASITLSDLSINVVVDLRLPTDIREIKVVVVLPAISATITGLLDNEIMSDIISRQLSETLTSLAKEEEERINKVLNDIIKAILEPENEKFNEVPDQNQITITDEYCYNVMAIVKQTMQHVLKKDFLMNWITKNLL